MQLQYLSYTIHNFCTEDLLKNIIKIDNNNCVILPIEIFIILFMFQ